jgi:hypothetical protein
MDKVILALALRQDDRRTRVELCALAFQFKLTLDRRHRARIRNKQNAMLMHLLLWYSQRATPDGLFEGYESLIELYIRKANPDKFRAAFRVSREIFDALLRALSPFITDGKSRNSLQNVTAPVKLGIALYYMAHGMDGDVLGGAAGLERHTALKYLHEVTFVICSELSKDWIGEGILKQPEYIRKVTARFQARRGMPYVAAALDGSQIPHKPNNGEHPIDFGLRSMLSLSSTACICLQIWLVLGPESQMIKHALT